MGVVTEVSPAARPAWSLAGPRPAQRDALAFVALVGVGLYAAVTCVRLTAPLQAYGARRLLGPWWSWTSRAAVWQREPADFVHGGLRVTAVVALLTAAWAVAAVLVRRRRIPGWGVAVAATAWMVPFAVAPPIMSRDAYAYLAQGAVGASGDPYRSPLSVLGARSPLLHAVDPLYRGQAPPYGPAGVRLLSACLAVTHNHPVSALIVLRLVVLASLLATVLLCARLVPAGHRALPVWLIAANPVVLVHLVGGLHLEAEVAAALAAAALLATRGALKSAAVLVVAAAAIKVTALVVLIALVAPAVRRRELRTVLTTLAAAVGAALALAVLLAPNPFGWLAALHAPLSVWDPVSLPTAAALSWAVVIGGSPLAVLGPLRVVLALLGIGVTLWACSTHERRPLAVTAGISLAAVLLTAPVLWPWYVVPAVVCLAATTRTLAPALGLTVLAVLSDLPMPVKQMQRVTVAGYVAVAVAAVLLAVVRRRRQALVSA